MKQLIIARKDLNMSAGKLATQVSHASMAFISHMITGNARSKYCHPFNGTIVYGIDLYFDKDTYEEWFNGSFTKVVCEAKNRNQLMKVVKAAEELGLKEGVDFFLIKDNCYTELTPEEVDENGIGRTLTCIGFIPLPDDVAETLSRKYQLYRG